MADLTTPAQGFQFKVKNLYDVEKQLEVALPKMADAATGADLAESFQAHLKETELHSRRLEQIFKIIGMPAEGHAGQAIRGLIADSDEIAAIGAPAGLRDAMLAGAGSAVESYEIACYTSAIEEAHALNLSEAVGLLRETLSEEEDADKNLAYSIKDNLRATLPV